MERAIGAICSKSIVAFTLFYNTIPTDELVSIVSTCFISSGYTMDGTRSSFLGIMLDLGIDFVGCVTRVDFTVIESNVIHLAGQLGRGGEDSCLKKNWIS